MPSSLQDISDLVFGNLVIANWTADNSVDINCFERFLVLLKRFS